MYRENFFTDGIESVTTFELSETMPSVTLNKTNNYMELTSSNNGIGFI